MLSSILMFSTSCEKEFLQDAKIQDEKVALPNEPDFPININQDGMIVLGSKLNNPYSVKNMQRAMEILAQQDPTITKDLRDNFVKTTHYYVRVLPKDEMQMEKLRRYKKTDKIFFYDYPLDYQILQPGSWYHDPSLSDSTYLYTWQYAAVPVDFVFPKSFTVQKLEELFLWDQTEKANQKNFLRRIWNRLEETSHNALETVREYVEGVSQELVNEVYVPIHEWTPSGNITVYDSIIGGAIPLDRIQVYARFWFKTSVGTTNENGNFVCDKKFTSKVFYSFGWDKNEWDIQDRKNNRSLFGIARWVSVGYQSPRISIPLRIYFNSGTQLRYAHIYRALSRYFHKERGGLTSPDTRSMFRGRVRVGYLDRNGRSSAIPGRNYLGQPHVYIYGKDNLGRIEPANDIFSVTIHELAHIAHIRLIGEPRFGYQWTRFRIIPESWADAVEVYLSDIEYKWHGYRRGNWNAINYYSINAEQDWTPTDDGKVYTPLFIDLYDTYNQNPTRSISIDKPYDNVDFFTMRELESILVRSSPSSIYTGGDLRTLERELLDYKSLSINQRADLIELLDFYKNL